jgi:Zn-dependent M28 family amino/carboxypeptidase
MQGNESVRPIFRAWLEPLKDLGASTLTAASTRGSDHMSFDDRGLPGFQFIQDDVEYFTRTWHSTMDVHERVIEEDVEQTSVVLALFAYQAAMRDDMIPRKPPVPDRGERQED